MAPCCIAIDSCFILGPGATGKQRGDCGFDHNMSCVATQEPIEAAIDAVLQQVTATYDQRSVVFAHKVREHLSGDAGLAARRRSRQDQFFPTTRRCTTSGKARELLWRRGAAFRGCAAACLPQLGLLWGARRMPPLDPERPLMPEGTASSPQLIRHARDVVQVRGPDLVP